MNRVKKIQWVGMGEEIAGCRKESVGRGLVIFAWSGSHFPQRKKKKSKKIFIYYYYYFNYLVSYSGAWYVGTTGMKPRPRPRARERGPTLFVTQAHQSAWLHVIIIYFLIWLSVREWREGYLSVFSRYFGTCLWMSGWQRGFSSMAPLSVGTRKTAG